jgi:hypothetical protein
MRKALVVGIDYYSNFSSLRGCVNDAHAVKAALERHSDGTLNFDIKLLTSTGPAALVSRADLRDAVTQLFQGDSEVSLFYFAGHGYVDSVGGYICPSEAHRGDDGLALSDILTLANQSKSQNKVVVLDSCHSGIAGTHPVSQLVELKEGMTILTASTEEQYASEKNGSGIFTTLFVKALGGAAANLVGDITPGSVYAHIDQSLGPWEQRPVFKTNVKSFVSLRKTQTPISLADLQRITKLFPSPAFEFYLDPSFEPEMAGRPAGAPAPDPKNVELFSILQKYNRVNLVKPENAPHMWHAAMESKSCKLTVLGEHYRSLVEKGRI